MPCVGFEIQGDILQQLQPCIRGLRKAAEFSGIRRIRIGVTGFSILLPGLGHFSSESSAACLADLDKLLGWNFSTGIANLVIGSFPGTICFLLPYQPLRALKKRLD